MKALSLKQPWATLIVAGIKPIENRTWSSSYRGRLLIHASQNWDEEGAKWIVAHFPELKGMIYHSNHLKGKIIGQVEMVDCVESYDSPWFFGPYGFVFNKAYEFYREQAIPYKGQLQIFEVSDLIKIPKPRRQS